MIKGMIFPLILNIVQYVHFSSNVTRCILYGIIGTQVIRYFRINNLFENFKLRVLNLY